jgi:hypothetical protein
MNNQLQLVYSAGKTLAVLRERGWGERLGRGAIVKLEPFIFAFRRVTFFCLLKRKSPKKRAPLAMACGFPVLLDKSGGCGTRCAQTVLAENS